MPRVFFAVENRINGVCQYKKKMLKRKARVCRINIYFTYLHKNNYNESSEKHLKFYSLVLYSTAVKHFFLIASKVPSSSLQIFDTFSSFI